MKLAVAALLAGSAAAFAPSTLGGRSATQLDARKPFITGNWKLNPQTRDEAVQLAGDIAASITDASPDADVALFVPYVFLEAAMGAAGDKLMVGAEVCVPRQDNVAVWIFLPTRHINVWLESNEGPCLLCCRCRHIGRRESDARGYKYRSMMVSIEK